MGIGVIGVVGGAAASPFGSAAEVSSVAHNGFYQSVTQNIPAGTYLVHFRGSDANQKYVQGILKDSNGNLYTLKQGENLITFPEAITGYVISKSFYKRSFEHNRADWSNGSTDNYTRQAGPGFNKYNGIITRRAIRRIGTNSYWGVASSIDMENWYRWTAESDANSNIAIGWSAIDKLGYVWIRARGTAVPIVYSTPDWRVQDAVQSNLSGGNNSHGMDFCDLSDNHIPALNAYWIMTNEGRVYYSTNKTSWFEHGQYNGAAGFFVVNGKLLISSAATTGTFYEINSLSAGDITAHTIGVGQRTTTIDWDGTNYVASVYNTIPYYSTDLATWTQGSVTTDSTSSTYDGLIKWLPADNEWIWVARYGVWTSADGQTWSPTEDPAWNTDTQYMQHTGGNRGDNMSLQFSDSRMPQIQMTRNLNAWGEYNDSLDIRKPGFVFKLLELA